jgi:hypothetical protein
MLHYPHSSLVGAALTSKTSTTSTSEAAAASTIPRVISSVYGAHQVAKHCQYLPWPPRGGLPRPDVATGAEE